MLFFCAFVRFLKRFNKRAIPITNIHLCTSLHKGFALFGKTGLGVLLHASEVLACAKIASVVVWRRDLRAVDLESGTPPRAHFHSQGRNGEGLTLASGLNWQRSGWGKLKMQTLGHVYVVQFNACINSGQPSCPHYTDEEN